jgi:hypothetical protein
MDVRVKNHAPATLFLKKGPTGRRFGLKSLTLNKIPDAELEDNH